MDHPMGEQRLSVRTDGDRISAADISSEDLPDAPTEEETTFSRWTLPLFLFALTVFTTLWAGAYQAYSGTIRGPVAFLWEHPEMLPQGIPFAGTLLFILLTHEFGHFIVAKRAGITVQEFGIGFPPFRGGPFRYMDSLGVKIVVQRLEDLNPPFPGRYEPAELLLDMARRNQSFYPDERE